jgi:hypothetical protein
MGWLFDSDEPTIPHKNYISDGGQLFLISQSYADMGEREGWLTLKSFKCNPAGVWTYTYRHI